MFGETLGGNPKGKNGQRDFNLSWMGSGDVVAEFDLIDPPGWWSFGSGHTAVVHFAYCDGSMHMLLKIGPSAPNSNSPQWLAFRAASRMHDGTVYDPWQIE